MGELSTVVNALAQQIEYSGDNLVETLKNTAWSSSAQCTDEQMIALVMVAKAHGLNPFTREIFAFPQGKGITPVVSIDGWLKIINSHPQFDGMATAHDPNGAWCEVTMYRKDRTHPTVVREFLSEVQRDTDVWRKYAQRMLRHKATIQAARYAFGFAGIYDLDEAESIDEHRAAEGAEKDITPSRKTVSAAELMSPAVSEVE